MDHPLNGNLRGPGGRLQGLVHSPFVLPFSRSSMTWPSNLHAAGEQKALHRMPVSGGPESDKYGGTKRGIWSCFASFVGAVGSFLLGKVAWILGGNGSFWGTRLWQVRSLKYIYSAGIWDKWFGLVLKSNALMSEAQVL